jgi:hypothetical protein
VDVDAGCLEVDLEDGGCLPLALSNLCSLRALTVLADGVPIDDATGAQLAQALVAHCEPAPPVRTVSSSVDGGVIAASGEPLVGRDEALVCGGGGFFQKHVDWLETTGVSPVYDSSTLEAASFSTRDGGVVFSTPFSDYDGGFDYFLLELVRTQPTGPLSLVGYGVFGEGTRAAGWFFENRIAPDAGDWSDSWYVIRWDDSDFDGLPSPADTFTVLGAGR